MTSDDNTSGLAPQRQMASDYDNSGLAPQLQKTSDHNRLELEVQDYNYELSSSKLVPNVSPPADTDAPSLQELDLPFSPLIEEYFTIGNQKPIIQPTTIDAEENNTDKAADAQFEAYEFINSFALPGPEVAEYSSRIIDTSNMHTFYQRHHFDYHWNKDYPLEQVHGNPSKPVQTRRKLATDPEMCMFSLTVSTAKPTNIKEAMADHAWINPMFADLDHPEKVYRLRKALYGLKQALRA
ncbi:hypothetical protein Tco_0404339, partial [Tanacetum coccineum]